MKKIFVSYSHKDEFHLEQLKTHLSGLVRQKLIDVWDDRQVLIGEKWNDSIKLKLDTSDIVLFLLSSDFLASTYINEVEIERTIERHKKGEVLIVPIFVRPCDFESSALNEFQGVPRDAKFIANWESVDSAFLEVTKELKKLIQNFKQITPGEFKASTVEIIGNKHFCDTPPDILHWVGREKELNILNSEHFKVIFITGFGGQGKSSLAARYISKHLINSPYEQWDWRDFKEEGNRLKTKLSEIIQRFSDSNIAISDLKEATYEELIDILFRAIYDKKIVFVFDNIDSYIDYEKFIPIDGFNELIQASLARPHNCKFIFTCRPFIKRADVGFYQLELQGLDFNSAVQLLEEYKIVVENATKDLLFRRMHKITSGHPLWLSLLVGQSLSGVDKLEELVNSIDEYAATGSEHVSKLLSDRILSALWNLLNLKQQKLLRCLSEIVKAEEINDLAKMIENELNFNQFGAALKRLKLLNLVVTKSKDFNSEEIELHPLVKSFIRSKFPLQARNKYISIIIDYYNKVTYILKERLSGREELRFYENWTNKVELALNKKDFSLALINLEEISNAILTAGYFEEYFRIANMLFGRIDLKRQYKSETEYLVSQIHTYATLGAEIGEFDIVRDLLDRYRPIIQNKGGEYIGYCKLECCFYWNKLENVQAISWGEEALKLIKGGKVDDLFNVEHSLNLAKRDSGDSMLIKDALAYFAKEKNVKDLISSEIDRNLTAQYYGNLGRCYQLLKEHKIAIELYYRSFQLCYEEENTSRFINRGYSSYWIAQLLDHQGHYRNAYFFYSNAIAYWKKRSITRSLRVERERGRIVNLIPEIKDLYKIDDATIENQCKNYVAQELNLSF